MIENSSVAQTITPSNWNAIVVIANESRLPNVDRRCRCCHSDVKLERDVIQGKDQRGWLFGSCETCTTSVTSRVEEAHTETAFPLKN